MLYHKFHWGEHREGAEFLLGGGAFEPPLATTVYYYYYRYCYCTLFDITIIIKFYLLRKC